MNQFATESQFSHIGLLVGDVACSSPDAGAYRAAAARQPLGCAELREAAKVSKHGADVEGAGHRFVPLVMETYGAMGGRTAMCFCQHRISICGHVDATATLVPYSTHVTLCRGTSHRRWWVGH